MKSEDRNEFSNILRLLLKTYGKTADKDLTGIFWNALADIDLGVIRETASAYIRTNCKRPTPADIRELAGANKSEWPTPEEAWNMLPKTEGEGGWMCQEIATAMGACIDSLDAGDRIGARMAFLEVYRREIQGKRGKPQWWLSEPNAMTNEQRLQWRAHMLEQKPGARPLLEHETRRQLDVAGIGITMPGGGLKKLSAGSVLAEGT